MSKNETGAPKGLNQQTDILADKIKDGESPTSPVAEKKPAVPPGQEAEATSIATRSEPTDWIIVVDDSPANLTIVCGVLNKLGFGTISYRDGQLALNGIENLAEERRLKVRAIFSDLLMPNLDGLALLREVRKSEKMAKIPFVMVTSSKERDNITEAATLKISGYLLKPITATTITDTINNLFPEKSVKQTEARLKVRRV